MHVVGTVCASLVACGSPQRASPPIGDALVEVPAQTVVIGSPEAEVGRDADEGPLTEVVLERFFVDRTPVTVAMIEARLAEVLAADPGARVVSESETPAEWTGRCTVGSGRGDLPATCVSPAAARAFCRLRGMDLPTEAEREAFARGGTRTPYFWGDAYDEAHTIASVSCGERGCRGAPAGIVTSGPRCNALGVCDVAGNVWEWTLTEYAPTHGPSSSVVPEMLPEQVVIRGASWLDTEPRLFRAAMRGLAYPDHGLTHIGFRCVRRGERESQRAE